jgi:predicted RNA binding protein YcfA (HicA-like mRNA interferase family)
VLVRQRGDHMVMQRQLPGSTITVPCQTIANSASARCYLSSANPS